MITSELIFTEDVQGVILHGLHWTASTIELLGVVVIVCGVVAATVWSLNETSVVAPIRSFRPRY